MEQKKHIIHVLTKAELTDHCSLHIRPFSSSLSQYMDIVTSDRKVEMHFWGGQYIIKKITLPIPQQYQNCLFQVCKHRKVRQTGTNKKALYAFVK